MCIIDRYLLRQFVQAFLICLLSLTGLFIVFDAFTNLQEFMRCGAKSGGVWPLIARHYAYQSILVFDQTAGFLALVAAMFTVSWIQRHNEMTALMAAGIARIRVVLPLIIAAATISLVAAANRELLIPRYRTEMSRRPQDLIGDLPQSLELRYDNQTDVLLGGKNTYADRCRIEEPEFGMPPTLRDYGKQLTAENAYYLAPEGQRPGGYLLDKVREPKNLDSRPSLFWNARAVLITPRDAPGWLKPDQCFLVSDLDFDQLIGSPAVRQLSSTVQLITSLHNPSQDFGAPIRVAIHARIVQPLLDITLLFLGLPLVVTKESRNVFLAMGVCMAVTATFSLVVLGAQQLGKTSVLFDPALAAWVPLMIFVPVAVGLAESMWK